MKFPQKAFVFNYLCDELTDLAAGIILFPFVVIGKILFALIKSFS